MGLEVAGTPASGNIECSIDSRGVAINSIQQFLTTFAVIRVIINLSSSQPTLTAFASVEAETGAVYSPESGN
jgi:hypothetical protein